MRAEFADRIKSGTRRDSPLLGNHALAQFDAIAARIAHMLSRARRAEIASRRIAIDVQFQIGDELHTLRTSGLFGSRAVGLFAESVGLDESGLQKWARMAERIRGEERHLLCSLVDGEGLHLPPSVFVELGRVRQASDRIRLAQEALEEKLSIERLRRRIGELKGKPL